jgi:hypothetical protein
LKTQNTLKLEGYFYRGRIVSEETRNIIIEEIFSNNAIMAFNDGSDIKFVTIGEFLKSHTNIDFQSIQDRIKVEMEIVDLDWSYRGNRYHSIAVVSDKKGIIYDNIGTLVVDESKTTGNISVLKRKQIILRTLSDSTSFPGESDPADTAAIDPEYQTRYTCFFTQDHSYYNMLGMNIATYYISCESVFNSSGTLVDKIMWANASSDPIFSCFADIQTTEGEVGMSKYHVFSWVGGYGIGSISVTFNGTGFTSSGTCNNIERGSETHNLSKAQME